MQDNFETWILLLSIIYLLTLTLKSAKDIIRLRGFPNLQIDRVALRTSLPSVSIIVPARNEEEDLPRCLDSLDNLSYPHQEIIVVDDRSTDATPDVIDRYPHARRICLSELPLGWTGKTWACTVGYRASSGSLLLFTDADTVHTPLSLSAAVGYLEENRVDMLTLWPYMVLESFWEKVAMPVVFRSFFLDFGGRKINDEDGSEWAGFGPYILIRRRVYEKIGTHESVRRWTDEDYRLAELVKTAGFRLRVLYGFEAVSTRMYKSFRELWEGWVKNAFAGYNFKSQHAVADLIRLGLYSVLPVLLLVGAVLFPSPLVVTVGIIGTAIVWARDAWVYWLLRCDPWYAILSPLGTLIYMGIISDSAIRHWRRKGVSWKGTTYY